jgi:hypothetical protein
MTNQRQRIINRIDNTLDEVWHSRNKQELAPYVISRIGDDVVVRDSVAGFDAFTGSRSSARAFLMDNLINVP